MQRQFLLIHCYKKSHDTFKYLDLVKLVFQEMQKQFLLIQCGYKVSSHFQIKIRIWHKVSDPENAAPISPDSVWIQSSFNFQIKI